MDFSPGIEDPIIAPATQSWVGTGPNLPISADQVHTAFGADTMQALAVKEFNNIQSLIHRGK
jgi:uncharacterized protein YidB (DUF937 family)